MWGNVDLTVDQVAVGVAEHPSLTGALKGVRRPAPSLNFGRAHGSMIGQQDWPYSWRSRSDR